MEESAEPGKEADPNFSRSMQTNPYPSWSHAKAAKALVFNGLALTTDPCFDCLLGNLMKPLFPMTLFPTLLFGITRHYSKHQTLF